MEELLLSFDNRPSIKALEEIEQKVIALLNVASSTCELLSETPNDASKCQSLASEYIGLVKDIKEGISTQILRLKEEVPYHHSTYLARLQACVAEEKEEGLRQLLEGLRSSSSSSMQIEERES